MAASRWANWPLDRVLVIAGFVATVLAGVILGSGDPSLVGPILILLLPGIAIVSLSVGAIAAGSLAYQNVTARAPNAGPVYDIPVTASVSMLASDSRFSPTAINVTASVVTKITILNEDDAPHTFTYTNNGTGYSHDLMGGRTTQFFVLFSRPGIVPFSSVLMADVGMNGTMTIVSP